MGFSGPNFIIPPSRCLGLLIPSSTRSILLLSEINRLHHTYIFGWHLFFCFYVFFAACFTYFVEGHCNNFVKTHLLNINPITRILRYLIKQSGVFHEYVYCIYIYIYIYVYINLHRISTNIKIVTYLFDLQNCVL